MSMKGNVEVTQTTNRLQARGLKPAAQLAADREHGDRLRYMGGCRCFQCRRANSAYEAARKVARANGEGNGIVPAAAARAHLKALSEAGIGRRMVSAASDVSETCLQEVIAGRKVNIRAATERAILAVTKDAAGDGALVPGKATWKMLDQLLADGYTKSYLAQRLGSKAKTPALQLKRDFVTVRSAHLVERLYDKLKFECAKPTLRLLAKLRDEGYTQQQIAQRLAAIADQDEPAPSIEPNAKGRISTRTADLVEQLYKQLTT